MLTLWGTELIFVSMYQWQLQDGTVYSNTFELSDSSFTRVNPIAGSLPIFEFVQTKLFDENEPLEVSIKNTIFAMNDNSEQMMPVSYLFRESSQEKSMISVKISNSTFERNIGECKFLFQFIIL